MPASFARNDFYKLTLDDFLGLAWAPCNSLTGFIVWCNRTDKWMNQYLGDLKG
jgi:hypothetical protein